MTLNKNNKTKEVTMGTESRLSKTIKGKLAVAYRYVMYGPEGVGKSSLAADAPSPIFLDIDDGSAGLDVARYPFRDEDGGHVPLTYAEVIGALEDLEANPHEYKTLVIDTADRLEALMWKHILKRDSVPSALNKSGKEFHSIEEFGYGKGYQLAVDEWRELGRRLDALRSKRGMTIVILAHTQIRTFKNPEGEDYDRYSLRINEKAAGFLREWADTTGFACFEEGGSKLDPDAKAKGYSTGRRLLKLVRTATYDAKTRLALPEQVELDPDHPWAPLAAAITKSDAQTPVSLAADIEIELARIGDADISAKVHEGVAKAVAENNKGALGRCLLKLQKTKPKEGKESVTNV
jgi:hypothetical protein